MASGGGLICATGDGSLSAAQPARVEALGAVGCSGTPHGSGSSDETSDLGSGSLAMPHLEMSGRLLDDAYPPLQVPQDEILEDYDHDANDTVYQSGLRVAEAIRLETTDQGRKRRMSPTQDEPKGSDKDCNRRGAQLKEDLVALVDAGQGEATLHSTTFCRRRSVCGGPALGNSKASVKNPDTVEGSELHSICFSCICSVQQHQSRAHVLCRSAQAAVQITSGSSVLQASH